MKIDHLVPPSYRLQKARTFTTHFYAYLLWFTSGTVPLCILNHSRAVALKVPR